jgi:hypothetical protein
MRWERLSVKVGDIQNQTSHTSDKIKYREEFQIVDIYTMRSQI